MHKSAPANAVAGNYITYTVTVTNNGPSDRTSATLTDTLSSELQGATFCAYTSGSPCDQSSTHSRSGHRVARNRRFRSSS